jgi:DNA polymerase I-like protein with 3'-5' exonuclease and polymerase domains
MRFITNSGLSREQVVDWLTKPKDKIAIDIETVSIDNKIPLGIGIAVTPDIGFYFFNIKDDLVKAAIESSNIILTHNGKFDIALLRKLGFPLLSYEDTKMIAYANGVLENTLPQLSESILHRDCPSVTSQWRKPNQGNIGIDHVKMGGMCIIHACNTLALESIMPKSQLYLDIDKPCIELLIEMEEWGLLVDQYMLTRVEQSVIQVANPMEEELKAELHIDNVNSNPQVAEALKNLGIIGTRKTKSAKDSVSDESLKPLGLPLTDKILRWRSLMKTISTYVPAFRNRVDEHGRLKTDYGHTRTGRWNSSKPNLQNLTGDKKFEGLEMDNSDEEEE